jgi:hypothetical protein
MTLDQFLSSPWMALLVGFIGGGFLVAWEFIVTVNEGD